LPNGIIRSRTGILSIILLLCTFVIGRVTHGTVRWIPIGSLTLQPSELVRPFLLLFIAKYTTGERIKLNKIVKAGLLILLPIFLILIQPSFSVAAVTFVGFLGVLFASNFDKKYLMFALALPLIAAPILWGIMVPYQRQRLTTFLRPASDPLGAGYNGIQSTIAAGAGKLTGRGLGKGIQTQLSFLPEKQTDFIFAAVSEEMGLVGASLMLAATFVILYRLTKFMERSVSPTARAYISGFFLTYLVQVFIHAGMNMGILPVTGLPYPLVSAGGSSLLATMTGLGIALGAYKR